jgi:hypothetical protein
MPGLVLKGGELVDPHAGLSGRHDVRCRDGVVSEVGAALAPDGYPCRESAKAFRGPTRAYPVAVSAEASCAAEVRTAKGMLKVRPGGVTEDDIQAPRATVRAKVAEDEIQAPVAARAARARALIAAAETLCRQGKNVAAVEKAKAALGLLK